MAWSIHRQVTVPNPHLDEVIEVDEGIADLLEILWRAGIRTDFSCEGEAATGCAYVMIRGTRGARAFLEILLGLPAWLTNGLREGSWTMKASCSPFSTLVADPAGDRVTFRIPSELLPGITEALTGDAPLDLTPADQVFVAHLAASWDQEISERRAFLIRNPDKLIPTEGLRSPMLVAASSP